MTPHSFREALDRLEVAVGRRAKRGVITPQQVLADRAAARAEVERLYAARVGEEYEVQVIRSEYDFVGVVLDDDKYSPGDRVFVTKGEAGVRSDCPLVGCTIAGPHDHNQTGPWEAKESA